MKVECEETYHATDCTVISEEKPETFKQGSITLATSDHILVCNAVTSNYFDVEEAITKLELENVTE